MTVEKSFGVRKLGFGIKWKISLAIAFPLLLSTMLITSLSVRKFADDKLKYILYVLHLSTHQICSKTTQAWKQVRETNPQIVNDSEQVRKLAIGWFAREFEDFEFSSNYLFSSSAADPLLGDAGLTKQAGFTDWLKKIEKNSMLEGSSQETWGGNSVIVSYCLLPMSGINFISLQIIDRAQALKPIDSMARAIVQIAFGVLALSAGLVFFLARSFSRPIQRLAEASDEIAAGNFQYKWQIKNRDEIGILSDHLAILGMKLQERDRQLSKANQMANVDHLTNIWNRRFLEEMLEKIFALAQRHQRPLSIVYLDLDHFKKINDTYGHDVGDQVLQKVGVIIRRMVRKTDVPARMGGEEFLVVLQEVNLEGAITFAKRLREMLKASPAVTTKEGHNIFVTASIGIASLSKEGPATAKDLIVVADQLAYKSKREGRDRINSLSGQIV